MSRHVRSGGDLTSQDDDEQLLFAAVEASRDALQVLTNHPNLSEAVSKPLRRLVNDGHAARERLLIRHADVVENLVARVASVEATKDDLRQEGMIGLVRAIEKFDRQRGVPFASYSFFWVYQAIARARPDVEVMIRIPSNVVGEIKLMDRARRRLETMGVIEVDPLELANECGMSLARVLELATIKFQSAIESLDSPTFSAAAKDWPADDSASEKAEIDDAIAFLNSQLAHLDERERKLFEMRFGLNGNLPCSLDEAAALLGVSRERIRQIEQMTLARLRHPQVSARLRSLLDD